MHGRNGGGLLPEIAALPAIGRAGRADDQDIGLGMTIIACEKLGEFAERCLRAGAAWMKRDDQCDAAASGLEGPVCRPARRSGGGRAGSHRKSRQRSHSRNHCPRPQQQGRCPTQIFSPTSHSIPSRSGKETTLPSTSGRKRGHLIHKDVKAWVGWAWHMQAEACTPGSDNRALSQVSWHWESAGPTSKMRWHDWAVS